MKRREFITLLGGAVAAWPLSGRAQQRATPVIGILSVDSPEVNAIRLRAFHEGLSTTGFVEGQNVKLEYRWAEGQPGRLPELAAQLVRDQLDVLVSAGGTAGALAAKAATTTIPIVIGIGTDPVEPAGLISRAMVSTVGNSSCRSAITAAYWFTSSTSFANPAVTIARGFTTTFAGIAINHVPAFIIAQLIGATVAAVTCSALFPFGKSAQRTVVVAGE